MRPARNRSRQREAILSVIQSTTCHPTAEWVYTTLKPHMPELSLGTVYRNLAILQEEGTIQSVGHGGGKEHFDGDMHPHAHLFCSRCGQVLDLMDVPPTPIPKTDLGEIAAVELTFHGTCRNCLAEDTE